MTADIVLVAMLATGFGLGFFRGALRQLLALGVWLVAFLLGANVRPLLGEWLGSQWPQFSRPYVEMLSFAIVFGVVLVVGVALAQFTGGRTTLTRHEWLDDVLGGLLGVGLVALTAAALFVILSMIYAQPATIEGQDLRWARDLHTALSESAIIGGLRQSLLPGLAALLGLLLPAEVVAVMG